MGRARSALTTLFDGVGRARSALTTLSDYLGRARSALTTLIDCGEAHGMRFITKIGLWDYRKIGSRKLIKVNSGKDARAVRPYEVIGDLNLRKPPLGGGSFLGLEGLSFK